MPRENLPPPPVPQKLRELLKDYPDSIQSLQQGLNRMLQKPAHGIDPFDRAIELIEGRLEKLISEASAELRAATSSGDAQAITQADQKESLLFRARSGSAGGGMVDLNDLRSYFDKYRRSFE